nr:TRIC cation channel family protein [Flavobacterium sp. B17]
MHEQFNFAIEVLGTISFSMSGSFAAMQKRLDPFGVLIIAFVTSVGGGTVRDLLLDIPVFWMHDLLTCSLIILTSIFTMIFKSFEKNFRVTLFIFDSFGLGIVHDNRCSKRASCRNSSFNMHRIGNYYRLFWRISGIFCSIEFP